MDFYRRLCEGMPDRITPTNNSFQVDPRQLRPWIAALPLANAAATARLLYQSLRELNHLRLDPAQRLAAMEQLRVPVAQVADTVDRQIVGSSFPLPPQKQQLGTIGRDFQHEMALGYRVALVDLCGSEGKVPFLRGKLVAQALERCIGHLGAQLSKAYLLYAKPADGVWQQLHDLFRFAVACKLDDKSLDDPVLGGAEVSPRQSYVHALLLAVCNPYRLSQKDTHESYLLTRIWASMVSLREGAPRHPRECAVPVGEDRGPGYIPEERAQGSGPVWSFDTQGLETELDRQLHLVSGVGGNLSFRLRGGTAMSVDPDLVARLRAGWQPQSERATARLPAGHQLDTLVGLHALHYFLAGSVDFETFVRRACGPAVHLGERERAASWAQQNNADSGKPDRYRARVLDQSTGGYRLEWEASESVRTRIGEIVGLALPSEDEEGLEWMVGIIRWLRIDAHGRVDAGIELLARQARAAALRVMDSAGRPKPPVRAVFLEATRVPLGREGAGSKFSVLAPSVLERGALRYELSAQPMRNALREEAEVRELTNIDVLESSTAYIRMAPREADAARI
jgi:hypothetical protein